MSFDIHTISVKKGSSPLAQQDRVQLVLLTQQAYVAGSGAGAAVTLAITGLDLPNTYNVDIGDLGQDATAYISARTNTGFTINIHPRLAANTLAAGVADLKVFA